MDKTVVRNAAVVLPDRVVENSAVVCEDGRVTTVCRDEDLPAGPQTITFTLTDAAGNTKVLKRDIVVPE